MHTNMVHFRKIVKSRKEQKLYETWPIGSAIKFKRKEMNLTLEEGSEGICSVSYLSKLENNQIEIGEQFYRPLVKRFQLEEVYNSDENFYDEDIRIIIDHLTFGTLPKEDLTLRYKDRCDYQSQLIHMGYHTLLKDYPEAEKAYRDLKMYVPHLKQIDFTLFLILSNINLYHLNRFSEAFDFLSFSPKFEELSQNLILLVLKWRLLNAFRMHRISEVFNNYPIYVNKLVDTENYRLLQEIRNAYVQFEAYFQNPKNLEGTLSKMNSLSQSDRDLVMAKSMFFNLKYKEVIQLAKPYYRKSSQWLVIYLMSLDFERMHDELNEVLSNTEELAEICNTSKLLISHLRHKYKGDKAQLLNYLRREILGIKHLTDEYHILDYLMVDAQRLFSEHQHYKEAVQVTTHYLPILKVLKKSEERDSDND